MFQAVVVSVDVEVDAIGLEKGMKIVVERFLSIELLKLIIWIVLIFFLSKKWIVLSNLEDWKK